MKKIETRTGATLCSSMRPRSAMTSRLNKFKLLAFAFMALLSVNAWGANDELTTSFIGVTQNSYTAFSNKTGTSGAVYAGKVARNNYSGKYAIQLNGTQSNNIVTTTSGGVVTAITITWATSGVTLTDGRSLIVYGKDEAYSATETSTSGTELGKITYHAGETSASLEMIGEKIKSYIMIVADNSIYMDKISITWSTTPPVTYTDYLTDCAEPEVWTVEGDFDGSWKDYDITDGQVVINNLAKNSSYDFKVHKTNGTSHDHYGASADDNSYTTSGANWTLNGDYNVHLKTAASGTYIIHVSNLTETYPQISVTYPTAYTITFNGNTADDGSTAAMTNLAMGEVINLTANGFTKDCKDFLKWTTNQDGTGTEYTDKQSVTVSGNMTLYAQWTPKRYDAIYDANGVTGYTGELPATVTYDCGAQVTVSQTPRLSKFGYTFIGWNTNPDATEALPDNYQFTIDRGDTRIYAIWAATKPTGIAIAPETGGNNPDKGTGVQMIVTLTPDASTMAEENREVTWSSSNSTYATVNQSGYVNFVGQGTVTITATSKVDGSVQGKYIFNVQAGSCAHWKISAYDEGGGNGTEDYFYQVGSGDEWRVKYVLPNGTRKFWVGGPNCAWSGLSDNWDFGWIRFKDRRDNSCGGDSGDDHIYPGQDAVGELVIWSNSEGKNYGIAFLPNYKISYMTDATSWRIMDFHSTSTQYSYETDIFQVPEGYKSNGDMKYYVGIEKNDGSNMFVTDGISSTDPMNGVNGLNSADMAGMYGKWHIWSNSCDNNWFCEFNRYYQVRFEMNGGDGNIDPMYFYGDNSQSFNTNTLTNPTKTGYNLTGWKDQDNHTYMTSQSITVTKDLVLTAQWQAATYAITFDKNGGASNGGATATYDNSTLTSVTHVTRTGYDLTGYYTAASDGKMIVTTNGTLVANQSDYTDASGNWKKASNCTLYAQWLAKQYTINPLELTGCSVTGTAWPTGTKAYGSSFSTTISANDGYDLPETISVSGATYTWNAETGVLEITRVTGDVTVSIVAEEKTYSNYRTSCTTVTTVTLNKGEHGTADGTATIKLGTSVFISFTAVTPASYYDLEGYYDGDTKVINADGTLVSNVTGWTTADGKWDKDATTATLTAKFTQRTYTVTTNDNGDVQNHVVNEGESYALPALSCESDDYEKVGWTKTAPINNGWASKPTLAGATVSEAGTYYAVYGEGDGDPSKFVKVNSITNGAYVITSTEESPTIYAMKYTSRNDLAATSITETSTGVVTATDPMLIWNVTVSGNAISLQTQNTGNTYIGISNDKNSFTRGDTKTTPWTVDWYNNKVSLCGGNDGDADVYLNYYDTKFGLDYDNSNNLVFYKQEGAGLTYISNPNCCVDKVAAPEVNDATKTHNSITLSWSNVTGATGYKVTINGATHDVTISSPSYTASGLTPNTAYTWTVVATWNPEGDYCGAIPANGSTTTNPVYTLTITDTEGVYNIKANGSTTKTQSFPAGTEITLSGTTRGGYIFGEWVVMQGETPVAVTDNKFIMPAANVTVTATFTTKKDYYVDDMNNNAQIVMEGKYTVPSLPDVVTPTSTNSCEQTHLYFVGWIEGEIDEGQTDVPTGLITAGSEGTANGKTYHAVWAEDANNQ